MKQIKRLALLICLIISMFYLPILSTAQTTTPLTVYTTGLFAEDGSVLYSVLLVSSPDEDLTDLLISSALPEGATFVDVSWTPESASFEGAADGIVTWNLPELSADTILGPFTYRVTFADSPPPVEINATVTWAGGEATYIPEAGELMAYETLGSITIDSAGTDGLTMVENTGVWIDVPADAFQESVTLTFERLPLPEDASLLPEVAEDTWWCSLFKLTVEPSPVTPLAPLTIIYPVRHTLTPGLPVSNFVQLDGGEWQLQTDKLPQSKATTSAFLKPFNQRYLTELVSSSGNFVVDFQAPSVNLQSFNVATGVATEQRAMSSSAASDFFAQLGDLSFEMPDR